MVSKYPAVTTARKAQGARQRRGLDYPKPGAPGAPKQDTVPVKGLSRAAIGLLARKIGVKLVPYVNLLSTGLDVIELAREQGLMVPWTPVRNFAPSSLYWTETRCTIYYPPQRLRSSTAMSCNVGHCNVPSYEPGNVGFDSSSNPIYGLMMEDNPCGIPGAETFVHRRTTRWARKVGAPVPTPVYRGFAIPELPGPIPLAAPWVFPQSVPRAVPAAKPVPGEEPSEPRDAPHPLALPEAWPDAATYAVPSGMPGVYTFPFPGTMSNPGIIPVPEVAVLTQPAAGGSGSRVTTRPGRASRPSPPPKRKKERKVNVASVGGFVWVAFNFATETIDFAENLWDALPKKFQTPRASLAQKYEDIYAHFGEIDLAQAIVGYVNNQVEDILHAATGIPAKRLSQQLGHLTGVDRAVNQSQKYNYAAYGGGSSLSDLIPHIDFDPNTGHVGLTVPAIGGVSVNLGNRVL